MEYRLVTHVSVQVLSPLAEDLFHKAIAMSGVAPLEAHYASNPLAIAQVLQLIITDNNNLLFPDIIPPIPPADDSQSV